MMRAALRHFVLLPLLLGYTVLLWLAATPHQITPEAIKPITESARGVFSSAGVRAASFVFGSKRGHIKRKHIQVEVFGLDTNGKFRSLLKYPRRRRPSVRLLQDPAEPLFLKMMGYSHISSLMGQSGPKRVRERVWRLRGSPQMGRFSRFYCKTDRLSNHGIDVIYTAAKWSTIHYKTGKVRHRKAIIHVYDCRTERSIYSALVPKIRGGKDGAPLKLFWGKQARQVRARKAKRRVPIRKSSVRKVERGGLKRAPRPATSAPGPSTPVDAGKRVQGNP